MERPLVTNTARGLGVRIGTGPRDDIAATADGDVLPNTGGMSVAPSWRDLPLHRIPRRLKHIVSNAAGANQDACWRMGEGAFARESVAIGLTLRPDGPTHGTVEPDRPISVQDYVGNLRATRNQGQLTRVEQMVSQIIADSPLKTYSKLLIRLHRLIAEGAGDSDSADEVRDEMDYPWYQMTPIEQDVAKQLSADLYALDEKPNGKQSQCLETSSRELAAQLSESQSRGEYLRALQLIQEHSGEIPDLWADILRGIFYRKLGLPDVGLLFLENASQRPTGSDFKGRRVLRFLWQHMNVEAAIIDATEGHLAGLGDWK